jgi:phospholipase C
MPKGLDDLKHIVFLMMENRSFDHMLGFLQSPAYKINGLDGNETNDDSTGEPIKVSDDAIFFGDLTPDPGHSHFDVMQQLFDGAIRQLRSRLGLAERRLYFFFSEGYRYAVTPVPSSIVTI